MCQFCVPSAKEAYLASEDGRDREQKIVILSDVLFRTFNLRTLFIFSDKFRKTISGSVTEIKRVAKVIFYVFKTRIRPTSFPVSLILPPPGAPGDVKMRDPGNEVGIRLTYIHSLYRLQKLAKDQSPAQS